MMYLRYGITIGSFKNAIGITFENATNQINTFWHLSYAYMLARNLKRTFVKLIRFPHNAIIRLLICLNILKTTRRHSS